jgi:hypothetical protein
MMEDEAISVGCDDTSLGCLNCVLIIEAGGNKEKKRKGE